MPRRRSTIQGRIVYDRKKHYFQPRDIYRILRSLAIQQENLEPEVAMEVFLQVLAQVAAGIAELWASSLRIHLYNPLQVASIIGDFIATLWRGFGEAGRRVIETKIGIVTGEVSVAKADEETIEGRLGDGGEE